MRIISTETWYLTEDRRRRTTDKKRSGSLLVAKGSEIHTAELECYPILEEPKAKAVSEPPENKAIQFKRKRA